MVLLSGMGIPKKCAQEALENLAATPARVLALHVQDEVFYLEGKLIRIASAASVCQPLHAAFLLAIEDLVAGLAGDSKLPAEIRHLLAG
jgi:hypothetical protein